MQEGALLEPLWARPYPHGESEVAESFAGEAKSRHDAMILLNSFIPLPDCLVVYSYLPVLRETARVSPFHFFEGCMAFLESLRDRLDQLEGAHKQHRKLDILEAVMS